MKKREFLTSSIKAVAGVAGLAAVSNQAAAQSSCVQADKLGTFVLIHGAWCGGFVYDEVAQRLRARGHRVYAPSLTGLGDRTHLMSSDVNLSTHVNDVLSLLRFEELDGVILAGHSYGGLVISGAVESALDRISSLVYLDALVPGFAPPEAPPGEEGAPLPSPGDTVPIDETFALRIGIEREDLWKYSPHPVNSFMEQFEFTGAHNSVPKRTFVWADQFPETAAIYEALRDNDDWTTYALAARHMLMFDAPDRVIEILETAV